VNFLTEVQPECDCMPGADVPVIQDQGMLVSDDIVAVEQASLDLCMRAAPLAQSAASDKGIQPGEDVLRGLNRKDAGLQIEEAERLGLGKREHELIEI
jgi:uncharacterized Fe-S center protein